MKKKWKGWLVGPLAAFALAVTAVVGTPALDGTAKAVVDVSKSCTLTVNPVDPSNEELAKDLKTAKVVIDLYKVAKAVPDSAYDTYTYEFQGGYAGLKYSGKPDNEEWSRLSAQAARIALSGQTPEISGQPASEKITVPEGGLYLAVARGSDISDYITTVKNESGEETMDTIANSAQYTYTFSPSLVSLPSKQADANGEINTAAPGDWLYDVTVSLKPERAVRFGSLEIVKTLQQYEVKDPATFVFQVDAFLGEAPNEQKVFSDVVSISFTPGSTNQKSKRIDNLPVGARVVVTEVYSGSVYHLVTEPEQTTTIEANTVVPVAFTNDYSRTDKGGGAVTNHFDYDDGWKWTAIPDDSEE